MNDQSQFIQQVRNHGQSSVLLFQTGIDPEVTCLLVLLMEEDFKW
ncbi:hypothetical protein ACFL4M_02735 [Pseudomonadota bacterium]